MRNWYEIYVEANGAVSMGALDFKTELDRAMGREYKSIMEEIDRTINELRRIELRHRLDCIEHYLDTGVYVARSQRVYSI